MTDLVPLAASATRWGATIDGAATWWWIHTGQAVEGNPLVAALIDRAGLTVGLALRTVAVLLLVGVVAAMASRTRWAQRGLVVAALAYAAVVGVHLEYATGGL